MSVTPLPQIGKINVTDPAIVVERALYWLARGFKYSPSARDSLEAFVDSWETNLAQLHGIRVGGEFMGAFATFIEKEKDGDALHVWSLGGEESEQWLTALIHYLDRYAQAEGCDSVKLGGRKGWQKRLAQYGYEPESILMRRVF